MPEHDRLPVNGLSVVRQTLLKASGNTASSGTAEATLAVQMHLTALNAKSEPEAELTREFMRVLTKEPPAAVQWAFQAWRDTSPYFPAVSDIRKLLKDWHRGVRERIALEERLEERFLLEERRAQGQIPDFAEIVEKLREVSAQQECEPAKRERTYRQRMEMRRVSLAADGLLLSEEQIRARRQKELDEIRRYREIDLQDE
jgi:hypothetical protein